MKTYYEILGVPAGVPAEEIKRVFRKEIARYHPDKVQHLGQEFQDIASKRAAELTEAYRVLMDPAARQKYDEELREGRGPAPIATPPPAAAAPPPDGSAPRPEEYAPTPIPESMRQTRATMSEFVKKATLARLRTAIDEVFSGADSVPMTGFDVSIASKPRGGLFKKSEPPVRLLVRLVPEVDSAAIAEAWPLALKAAKPDTPLCLLLVGLAVSPSDELASTIAEQRRKSRQFGPVVVPVDSRDWDALFPPETPTSVRSLIGQLKQQK